MESEISAAEQKQWDIVVEATGNSGGLALAMQLVRPRGVICLKSTMAQAEALDLTPLVIDEIQVVGSRCGQLASALRFLERHPVPVERLIDGVYSMADAEKAWEHAQRRGAKKILLKME